MSRLTKLYTNAEESYIDLICFEDLDNYDVLYEVLDCGQYHGLIDAIYKLAEYENLGSVEDFKQLSHELEVYKRALELALISRKEMLEKQNCFTCSVEKAKIEFLDQARKELEDERK